MNSYENIKELLGQELVDSVYSIKEDANKLDMLSTLCLFLQHDKRKNDFEKLKSLLIDNEDVLIRINGSKYLNRFYDYDVTFDEENEVIILKGDILDGNIGFSFTYEIYETIKKDSSFYCNCNNENLILDFSKAISI